MGEVYEVVHTTLGRRAALKVIHPSLAQDANVVARFLREAQATNQVRHPGVVQIFEYGQLPERPGVPYFVMEFLEGETLSKCIRRAATRHGGRLGLSCLRLLQQVAKTLAAVHSQGLVHRDVKPANIMIISDPDVTDGKRIKLLDFGIVKILSSVGSTNGKGFKGTTAGRTVLGTPEFMAPEQWTARDCVDGRADVYALGVISFLCFAGRLPFVAENYVSLGLLHCQTRPPSLSDLDLNIPRALAELVAGMLEKNPAHRPTMVVVEETMGRLLPLSQGSETLPTPAESGLLERSELAEPEPVTEVSSVVSTLQTYTWEEVELGIVGPSFEESLPGEPPVQVRVLSSLPQLPIGFGAKSTQLTDRPPLSAPPAGLSAARVQVGNEAPDCTPQPSPFYFLQRSLTMGSRLSWPWYLLTAAVLVCVLWLLPRRPHQDHQRPAAPFSERSVAPASSVRASVVALGTASGTSDWTPPGDSYRQPQSHVAPTPAVDSVPSAVEPASVPTFTATAPRAHRHHTHRSCERKFPTSSCIRNAEITLEQRMTLLRAFYSSNTKLCAHEQLVVSASPRWPSIQTVPAALSGSTQASLLVALRLLYHNQPTPASIVIRCPSDGPRPRHAK